MYRNYDHVYCPSCGSRNLRIIEERNNESYNLPSGILGAICFGPIGMLCGLCCADCAVPMASAEEPSVSAMTAVPDLIDESG